MKITEIRVSAGRTFNHPFESYSNLRPEVELRAMIYEGEDPVAAARTLQAEAEQLVEDHKQNMLKSIEDLHNLSARQAEIAGLGETILRAQERLDKVRNLYPELAAAPAPPADPDWIPRDSRGRPLRSSPAAPKSEKP